MRLLVGIQSLVHQFPRGLYTQPKKQYLVAVHSGSLIADFPGNLAQVTGRIPLETSRSLITTEKNARAEWTRCESA